MIPPRERLAVIQSLAAGVVPAVGLHHIQVGRNDEVQALVKDLDHIAAGGAACRFVIGNFGSGKTFLLNLLRTVALQRRFVVAQADITTDRRLHGSAGQARALYCELTKNISLVRGPKVELCRILSSDGLGILIIPFGRLEALKRTFELLFSND